MKHAEVIFAEEIIGDLIEYFAMNKVNNFPLHYGLQKNLERITKAANLIRKGAAPDLIELEKKAYELASKAFEKEQASAAKEAEKNPGAEAQPAPNRPKDGELVMKGFALLSKKEKEQHANLLKEYNEFLQQENDLEIFYIDYERISSLDLDFAMSSKLALFVK